MEALVRDMVTRLMEEKGLTMREAMDIVYRSHTAAALSDVSTGLYFQSSAYVYDALMQEQAGI